MTSTYDKRYLKLRSSLIPAVKQILLDKEDTLETWILTEEAFSALTDTYRKQFEIKFGEYMDDEINERLWFFGMNAVLTVQAYLVAHRGHTVEGIIAFIDAFVGAQLDTMPTWCPELQTALSG